MFEWKQNTGMWAEERMEHLNIDGSKDRDFFERFRKKDYQSDVDFSKYFVHGREGAYVWEPNVDMDAYNGLLLRYDGSPKAVISYGFLKPSGDSFAKPDMLKEITDEFPLIIQIQGQAVSEFYLSPIKWERLLVAAVESAAANAGFNFCGIRPAEQIRMRQDERCKMRYDTTAKRSGYKMKNGLWLKELHTHG